KLCSIRLWTARSEWFERRTIVRPQARPKRRVSRLWRRPLLCGFPGSGLEFDFHRDLAVDGQAASLRGGLLDVDVCRQTKNLATVGHGRKDFGATALGRF